MSDYTTDDNVEAANRLASGVSTVGRALSISGHDAFDNVVGQHDINFDEDNKDIRTAPAKPPGTDYAAKVATAKRDYGTRAASEGVKGTMRKFHKGGKVKKTAAYRLLKGERVLSPKQTKKFEKKGGLRAVLGGK